MQGKTLKFVSIMGGVVGATVIALGVKTLVGTSTPPPKSYDVAMYDVYSALLQSQEGPWLYRVPFQLLHPQPEGVLIRVDTLSLQDSMPYESLRDSLPNEANRPSPGLGILPEERFKPAVDAAARDSHGPTRER